MGRGAAGPKGGRGVEARRRPGRGGEWRGAADLAEAGRGVVGLARGMGWRGAPALGAAHWADSSMDLVGAELCGGEIRQEGALRWGRHAGVCSQAAAESGSSRETTEWGLSDRQARMGSLTSGTHQSDCTIMSVGFK
jgi:hypothetical protein